MSSLVIGILALLVSVGIAFVSIWITINPIPPDKVSLKRTYILCISVLVIAAVVLGIWQIMLQESEKKKTDREHAAEVRTLTEKIGSLEGINRYIQRQVDQIPERLSLLFKNPALSKDEIIKIIKSSLTSMPNTQSPPEQTNIDPYTADNDALLTEATDAVFFLKHVETQYPISASALRSLSSRPEDDAARNSITGTMADLRDEYDKARFRASICMKSICTRMKIGPPQPIPRILQENGGNLPFDVAGIRPAIIYLENLISRFRAVAIPNGKEIR